MIDALVSKGDAPVDCFLVVVEDANGVKGVGHVEVNGNVADACEGGGTLVCRHDLCLTGALGSLLLPDGFPGDGLPATADKEA